MGRGATEHILPDAQNFVRLKYVSVGTSGRGRDLIFLSSNVLVPSWAKRSRFVGLGEIKNPRREVGDFEVYLKNKGKT